MIQNSDLQFLGAKNYLLSPGIETGRQGWGLFNTTLTSKIPTGSITSGAASITTFAPTSTNPLSGDYSLRVASSGAVTAGHGFISDAFTIDRQDKAKVLGFSFSYEAISGTMDFSGTSANTWAVYIYDVDGAAWIQPAGVYNMVQSSGVGIASGTFQTTATGTQYRVAVVCITATGGAVEIRFDSFSVGPQKTLQGPSGPVGEIIATGSVTPPSGFLYCNGQSVSVSQYQDLFNSIGYTYGGSGASFNVPDLRGVFLRGAGSRTISGVTYSGTLGSSQVDQMQGHKHIGPVGVTGGAAVNPGNFSNAQFVNTGSGSTQWNGTGNDVYYTDSTNSAGRAPSIGSETRPANVAVAYHIRYLATYQMSQDTDTRVVACVVQFPTGAINTTPTTCSWSTKHVDTHNAFSGSTYTIPVAGLYTVTVNIDIVAAATTNYVFAYLKNGSVVYSSARASYITNGQYLGTAYTELIQCKAGDTIAFQNYVSTGSAFHDMTTMSIQRVTGPATIAASETVAMRAYKNTGSHTKTTGDRWEAVSAYNSAPYDTHGGLNITTGEYTVPVSGTYQVSGTTAFLVGAGVRSIRIDVNGSVVAGGALVSAITSVYDTNVPVSAIVKVTAGQTIRLSAYQDTGAILGYSTSANYTHFSIVRVGN